MRNVKNKQQQNYYFYLNRCRRGSKTSSFSQLYKYFLLSNFIVWIIASKCTFKEGNSDTFYLTKDNFPSSNLSTNIFKIPQCACAEDWTHAFCSRSEKYLKMSKEKAPTICVCRKMIGIMKCVQFLSRCFRHNVAASTGQINIKQQHRPLVINEKCSCCFNQPDAFCNQLECHQMSPIFEQTSNTSCKCFSPKITEEKISKKYLNLIETLCGEWKGKIIDYDGEEELKLYSSSTNNNIPSTSQSTTNKNLNNLFNSTAPYARFLSFLLIVLIGSLILAILACFWSHWRRNYLRKKCEIKLENEQKQIKRSQQLLCEQEEEGGREEENLNLNEINNTKMENERRRIIVQEIAV